MFELQLIDELASGIEREGTGFIRWDLDTALMCRFDWDFREGAQPGGKGNIMSQAFLASPLGGGTTGAALWELITGEDVFPDPIAMVTAFASSGDISNNGYPNERAEFFPDGRFRFFEQTFTGQGIVLAGEGTIRLRVPEPATLMLLAAGLAAAGRRRNART
ncbi:MAG: PEP-CTERM sorting domain-containing protein [Gammaproteobacteria bacterium]|nr:PEP-CTERM sorting domain-containing protein [Gammaproteobacteria bacterium]